MEHSKEIIRADFDRLAEWYDEDWNHNSHYHAFLLRQVPARCSAALDIGCGTGGFTRLLAGRADEVLGIDLSPNMIHIAQQHSVQFPNVRYQVMDVLTADFASEAFDCIVSIATLHHLPLDTTLLKMKAALKVGGTLLVLDLFRGEGYADMFSSLLAIPASLILRLIKLRRMRASRQARAAWAIHGQHDAYLTLQEIRRIASPILPGVTMCRHLLWRYSMIWHKPVA